MLLGLKLLHQAILYGSLIAIELLLEGRQKTEHNS
jgi:hypothetical protein